MWYAGRKLFFSIVHNQVRNQKQDISEIVKQSCKKQCLYFNKNVMVFIL